MFSRGLKMFLFYFINVSDSAQKRLSGTETITYLRCLEVQLKLYTMISGLRQLCISHDNCLGYPRILVIFSFSSHGVASCLDFCRHKLSGVFCIDSPTLPVAAFLLPNSFLRVPKE